MRRCLAALAVALIPTLDGCASGGCTPATIEVADKDVRLRLQSEPRGLRTDELGRVKEQRRQVILSDYWLQDRRGRWHRVPEAAWRAAEPGRPAQVCEQTVVRQ